MDLAELNTTDPLQEEIDSLKTQLGNAQDDLLKRNQQITSIYKNIVSAVINNNDLDDEQKQDLLENAAVPNEFWQDEFLRSFDVEVTFTATVQITKTITVEAPLGADEDQIIDALENDGIDVTSEFQDSSVWDFDWTDEDYEVSSFDEQ